MQDCSQINHDLELVQKVVAIIVNIMDVSRRDCQGSHACMHVWAARVHSYNNNEMVY